MVPDKKTGQIGVVDIHFIADFCPFGARSFHHHLADALGRLSRLQRAASGHDKYTHTLTRRPAWSRRQDITAPQLGQSGGGAGDSVGRRIGAGCSSWSASWRIASHSSRLFLLTCQKTLL